jgi:hypothetical protein
MSHKKSSAAIEMLRKPAVQFLLAGSLIAMLNHLFARDPLPSQVVIDADILSQLSAGHESQFGTTPDADALETLIDRYVEDEVLYREGLALGLDEGDLVVRRRVVQKMRFLVEDRAPAEAPSGEDLERWYETNIDRYVVPESISFTHVYFATDRDGEADARARAEAALAQLEGAGGSNASARGDRFPGPVEFGATPTADLARAFGNSELADALPELPTGAWTGPFRSGFGWHLVFVSDRYERRRAPFAEVRAQVEQDLIESRRSVRNEGAIDGLRAKYSVVRSN